MGFRKDFLWGGAVAAHQLEGAYDRDGKGLSIMDVVTGGDVNTRRRITGEILKGGNGNDTVDLGQYDFDESIGAKIAEAGLQKIGYNYAFGGLTWCNDTTKKGSVGIDCSGFTYILTKEITGKTIPRTAAAQSQGGISINSLADAKAGDFIFYGRNGVTGVGHVGIYLGNGKIVHASNPNDGVKISNATYKQILAIRRYW